MSTTVWLLVHLVAVAVLTGVGWVVQLVVYPAFALVDEAGWARFHARHTTAITRVVVLPWAAQGVSTVALLLRPPGGAGLPAAVVLAALALTTVVLTFAAAVPAHRRLGTAGAGGGRDLTLLLRAHLARTLAWTVSTGLAAALLVA